MGLSILENRGLSIFSDKLGIMGVHTVRVIKHHDSDLFDADATTASANIWEQPAGSVLIGIEMVLNQKFVAAGLTDLDVTLGLAGDPDGLLAPTMNGTSDAVGTSYTTRGAYWDSPAEGCFWYAVAATTWVGYSTATGANLSTLTAGEIVFYFTYVSIP